MTPPLVVKTVDGALWYVDVTAGKPDRKIAPYPNVLGAGHQYMGRRLAYELQKVLPY